MRGSGGPPHSAGTLQPSGTRQIPGCISSCQALTSSRENTSSFHLRPEFDAVHVFHYLWGVFLQQQHCCKSIGVACVADKQKAASKSDRLLKSYSSGTTGDLAQGNLWRRPGCSKQTYRRGGGTLPRTATVMTSRRRTTPNTSDADGDPPVLRQTRLERASWMAHLAQAPQEVKASKRASNCSRR